MGTLLLALLLQAQAPIHLVCDGGGNSRQVAIGTGTITDGYDSAQVMTQRQERAAYDDQVTIELNGETGRIRPPSDIRPPLSYGGNEGWWPLRNVRYSENEISASFALNFMNNPRVRIDRVTGVVSIRGKNGSFLGRCEPYDPATVRRRF